MCVCVSGVWGGTGSLRLSGCVLVVSLPQRTDSPVSCCITNPQAPGGKKKTWGAREACKEGVGNISRAALIWNVLRTGVPLVTPNLKPKPATPGHPQPRRCQEQQTANDSSGPRQPLHTRGQACPRGERERVSVQALWAARVWISPHADPGPRVPADAVPRPRSPEDVRHGGAQEVQIEVLQHRQPAQLRGHVQAHVEERRS